LIHKYHPRPQTAIKIKTRLKGPFKGPSATAKRREMRKNQGKVTKNSRMKSRRQKNKVNMPHSQENASKDLRPIFMDLTGGAIKKLRKTCKPKHNNTKNRKKKFKTKRKTKR